MMQVVDSCVVRVTLSTRSILRIIVFNLNLHVVWRRLAAEMKSIANFVTLTLFVHWKEVGQGSLVLACACRCCSWRVPKFVVDLLWIRPTLCVWPSSSEVMSEFHVEYWTRGRTPHHHSPRVIKLAWSHLRTPQSFGRLNGMDGPSARLQLLIIKLYINIFGQWLVPAWSLVLWQHVYAFIGNTKLRFDVVELLLKNCRGFHCSNGFLSFSQKLYENFADK